MQVAVIEFARHVCGLADANSGEFAPDSPHKVIDFLPDQSDAVSKGGTLRLGAYPCRVEPGSRMASCYGEELIRERHRHRYEFNNDYRQLLEERGLRLCGQSPDGHIVEAVELGEKRFFLGVQFHPEFKSRPNRPHPLFVGLIAAAMKG
jgi:CTP synthase